MKIHHHHLHNKLTAPTQQQTPHTVSTIKLPTLKKGEYDIWAMEIKHYLAHTDYPIWEVIQNGNGPVSVTTDTAGQIKILPPKTAEEIVARERERKARTTLLMANYHHSSCPQLDHEDLDQVDEYDLEEMDLKWQVAMISMRIKKFYNKTGRKLQFEWQKTCRFDKKPKVECYNCHKDRASCKRV
ncbi:hypothetical protein Tco_1393999 [Tanacetum coccineum]